MTEKEAEAIIKAAGKVISNPNTLVELAAILAKAVMEAH